MFHDSVNIESVVDNHITGEEARARLSSPQKPNDVPP